MPLYSGGLWEAVKLMAPSAFSLNHGMGNCRGGGGFSDQKRSDAVGGENFVRHGAEGFAQEARVAAHDHASAGGFLRSHIAGDSGDGATDVGEGEFVRHDGAPARGSKMNFCGHVNLPIATGCYSDHSLS